MTRFTPRTLWPLAPAALVPMAVAVLLTPTRSHVESTDLALMLVLTTVAIASTGNRFAGLLAAASTAVWFDFFLTVPYGRFTMDRRSDVVTAALLVLVGAAVTEIAVWGRRQQAEVARRAGFERGIREAAAAISSAASGPETVDALREQLTGLLDLEECRFDYGSGVVGGHAARLGPDGQVLVRGRSWDVDAAGFPAGPIEVPIEGPSGYYGRFLLRPRPGARPSLANRAVAVALAQQAAGRPAGQAR